MTSVSTLLRLRSAEHDRFGRAYRRLRQVEGWMAPNGAEVPDAASPLWRDRVDAGRRIAALLRPRVVSGSPLVGDLGGGGGWLRDHLPADWRVVSVDWAVTASPGLSLRADMRALPFRDEVLDAAVFVASLHYGEPDRALQEAARVLRPRAALVVAESPVYRSHSAASEAARRSAAYFAAHGVPELAEHYRPLAAADLRRALESSGFAVERFGRVPPGYARWQRVLLKARFPLVLARRA